MISNNRFKRVKNSVCLQKAPHKTTHSRQNIGKCLLPYTLFTIKQGTSFSFKNTRNNSKLV